MTQCNNKPLIINMDDRYAIEKDFWDRTYSDITIEEMGDRIDLNNFHPVYDFLREYSYTEYFFHNLIKEVRNKRVLSIGGGVDKIALYLAKKGNDVVSVDISRAAANRTLLLAKKLNVEDNLKTHCLGWEEVNLNKKFDIAICHDALHHMKIKKSVKKIHDSLEEDGIYFGMEPVCLSRFIRFLHKKFPFYPTPFLEGEIELTRKELEIITKMFKNVEFYFFDFLTRESISYILYKFGCRGMIRTLGKLNFIFMKQFPVFKNFGSYVVFRAIK